MIIVKGDLGLAINPICLKIIPKYPQPLYHFHGEIEQSEGYCIQAVFEGSERAELTGKINTLDEAKKMLDEMYKGIKG